MGINAKPIGVLELSFELFLSKQRQWSSTLRFTFIQFIHYFSNTSYSGAEHYRNLLHTLKVTAVIILSVSLVSQVNSPHRCMLFSMCCFTALFCTTVMHVLKNHTEPNILHSVMFWFCSMFSGCSYICYSEIIKNLRHTPSASCKFDHILWVWGRFMEVRGLLVNKKKIILIIAFELSSNLLKLVNICLSQLVLKAKPLSPFLSNFPMYISKLFKFWKLQRAHRLVMVTNQLWQKS